MSGPNTSYDPVEVAALDPEAIAEARAAALAAAAAASTLEELKAARAAHQGDRSPLALANREIGARLYISEQTVKNHVASIFRKLHVNDRTKAALLAVRLGLGGKTE